MPLPLFKLALMAGAGYFFYNRYRNRAGSQTNASEAVDDIDLGPDATHDETLDAGVKETFPASDRRRRKGNLPGERPGVRYRAFRDRLREEKAGRAELRRHAPLARSLSASIRLQRSLL
jgi:hypothetical protein